MLNFMVKNLKVEKKVIEKTNFQIRGENLKKITFKIDWVEYLES